MPSVGPRMNRYPVTSRRNTGPRRLDNARNIAPPRIPNRRNFIDVNAKPNHPDAQPTRPPALIHWPGFGDELLSLTTPNFLCYF
jgi:hypothetical protein